MLGIIKKNINNKFFIILSLSLLCFILLMIYSKMHIVVEGYSSLEEAYNDINNKETLFSSENNKLNSINSKINSLNKDYDNAMKNKPTLEKELTATREEYNKADKAYEDAVAYEKKKSKDRGDQKSRNRHDNAKKDRDRKKVIKDDLLAKINKITKEIDDIQKIKDNIDKETTNKKNIENSLKAIKNEIDTATSKIEEMRRDIPTLNNYLNFINLKISSLNKDYDNAIQAKKKLEDEMKELVTQYKNADKVYQDAVAYEKKKSKDRGDQKSRNRHDNAKKARDNAEKKRNEIKVKVDNKTKEINNKTNDIQKIKDNIDKENINKKNTEDTIKLIPSPTKPKITKPKSTPIPTTPIPTTPIPTTQIPTTQIPTTPKPTKVIPNADVLKKEYNFEKPPIDSNNIHWSQTNNIVYLQEGMTSTIAPPNVDNITNSEYIISSLLLNPEITSYYSLDTYGKNWTKADLITSIKSILENSTTNTSSLSKVSIVSNPNITPRPNSSAKLDFLPNISKNTNKMTVTDINGNPYEFLNFQKNQPNGTDGKINLELENQSIKKESEVMLQYNIPKNVTTDSNGDSITLNTGNQKCKYKINCTKKHFYRPNCSTVINKNGDCDCSCNDQIIMGSGEPHSHCISEDLSTNVFHYLSSFKNIQINVQVPDNYSNRLLSSGTVTYDPDISYLCELIADYYILLLYNKEKINLSYEKQQLSNTKEQSYHDANYLYQSDYIKMVNISVGILATIYIMCTTVNK